ncbi:helix-turn-helix transcriptional regulator [Amycolatopsis sp. NPDC051372]|uniref:helix-turn-helix domain-containing protein n=1 Tax=Amycolatopsis sp. NPDC051372 TaxID=3155669 RepID=UPI00341C9663
MPKVNGPLLRRTRRSRDMSVDDVAPHLEISPGTLRNIENMRAVASERLIGRIARFYDLDEVEVRKVPQSPRLPCVRKSAPIKTQEVA